MRKDYRPFFVCGETGNTVILYPLYICDKNISLRDERVAAASYFIEIMESEKDNWQESELIYILSNEFKDI